jgi:GT2 family glycosyltransferase
LEVTRKIGLFILHYEQDAVTDACVEAFDFAVNGLDAEVETTIIDNGSPVPYQPAWEHLRILRLDFNLPVVEALNIGMLKYPADVYFLANNDAMPARDCLHRLLAALDDPSVGIVAAGTSDISVGQMYVPEPSDTLTTIDMNHVDGHLWGWRSDLVNAIGLPDCEGHMHQMCWGSNRDYCYRARQQGFRVVCVRSAFVDHQRHETYDRSEADRAGREWIQQKWGALAPAVEA